MRSCFFIGQRMEWIDPELNKKLIAELQLLTDNGVTDFYSGCVSDWDILCINHLLAMRMHAPEKDIRLHLILPCPPEIFTESWSNERRDNFNMMRCAADSIETVSPSRVRGCLQKRNARLSETGEVCLCYYNEKCALGAAAQTVRMARERGAAVINHFE